MTFSVIIQNDIKSEETNLLIQRITEKIKTTSAFPDRIHWSISIVHFSWESPMDINLHCIWLLSP